MLALLNGSSHLGSRAGSRGTVAERWSGSGDPQGPDRRTGRRLCRDPGGAYTREAPFPLSFNPNSRQDSKPAFEDGKVRTESLVSASPSTPLSGGWTCLPRPTGSWPASTTIPSGLAGGEVTSSKRSAKASMPLVKSRPVAMLGEKGLACGRFSSVIDGSSVKSDRDGYRGRSAASVATWTGSGSSIDGVDQY